MKTVIVVAVLFLSGCAQLMKGEMQPVVNRGGSMVAPCSGAVEDWASCNRKAKAACPNGYETLNKEESPVGGKRELTFQCK